VVVICGPTGVGKTALAIRMASLINGEIIGADSMQVYKYMDIGTAKPTLAEQKQIRHHLIDVFKPDEVCDAVRFSKMAHAAITALAERQIVPCIVGGTGLYIKALLHGLCRSLPANETIRRKLKTLCRTHGAAYLYARLESCDQQAAGKIHPNDIYRIIRALEIYETTGKPISAHHERHRFARHRYEVLKIGLHLPRDVLYARIDQRVDKMIAMGLPDEVRRLLDAGYTREMKSMQALGYRHMIAFIDGYRTWDETVRLLKRDTRRYAKRQLTWFNADSDILWAQPDQDAKISGWIQPFILS
jgi:tRNA dimethylallyltransferase